MKSKQICIVSAAIILIISCASGTEKNFTTQSTVSSDDININFDNEKTVSVLPPIFDDDKTSTESIKQNDVLSSLSSYEQIKEEAEKIRNEVQNANLTNNHDKDYILCNQVETNTKSITGKQDFYNAIVEYDFIDGKIYDIISSSYSVTDIRLEKGERILGNVAIGDPSLWMLETTESEENGDRIVHLLVKAQQDAGYTTMIVPTTRRTYYFRLTATDKTAMVGCRFIYNKKNYNIGSFAKADDKKEVFINAGKMDFNYSISNDYPWAPAAVFSDTKKTVIQFPPSFTTSSLAPALYIKRGNDIGLINYIIKGNLYITDTIINDEESLVLITNGENIEINRSYE